MIDFLECRILPMSDGTYQLCHSSGAIWRPADLSSCLQAATKAWAMSRSHPAVVIQPGGWMLSNHAAIAANWPYCCCELLASQIYQRLIRQPESQGLWGDCHFQKVLVDRKDFLLLEAAGVTSK